MADQNPVQPGQHTGAGTQPGKKGIPWRLVALGAVGLYGLLIVILNARQVRVHFVFFSTQASLVVLLLVTLGVGFLGGFLFDTIRERRKRQARGS
jgi:uncharacterized integral membrane protein